MEVSKGTMLTTPAALRGTATKLNTFLEYPLENLDMSPFLSTRVSSREVLYDLYGVIVHKGDFKVSWCCCCLPSMFLRLHEQRTA